MNILNRLSIKNIKLNKKRTISTVIGIILSTALICASATILTSFQKTMFKNEVDRNGYYHLKIYGVNDNEISKLKSNRDVKDIHIVNNHGVSLLDENIHSSKPYLNLLSMNRETFDSLKFKLIEGNFPKNDKEIVISESIMNNAKFNYKIGDKIKLNIGEISDIITDDTEDTSLANTKEYEFNIVGKISKLKDGSSSYTVITANMDTDDKNAYVSLKHPMSYKTSIPELLGIQANEMNYRSIITEDGKGYEVNNDLLRWEVFKAGERTTSVLLSTFTLVIFVIIITSVYCIRNSFAISVAEKIKMNGMLASVGATKKQIKRSVLFEALVLGLIGVPLGILSGLLAVFVLTKTVNGIFLHDVGQVLVFSVSIIAVIVSAALAAVTIYLSAISSARKASKVSPIENLRNSGNIKINAKKLKVPKVIGKLFNIGGVMAYKNLKRSKKKYRTTVISIAVSVLVFIVANSLIANLSQYALGKANVQDFNIAFSSRGLSKEECDKITSLDGVKNYYTVYKVFGGFTLSDLSKINTDNGIISNSLSLIGLDSKSFKTYAEKIGVNYEDVKSSAILFDAYLDKSNNKESKGSYNYSKGDTIYGTHYGTQYGKELSVKVGAVTDIAINDVHGHISALIVNMDEYKDIDFVSYGDKQIFIDSDDADYLQSEINNINSELSVYNRDAVVRTGRNLLLVINVFSYGFIAVITLIGVTSIFNTITSNVNSRRKEFAMLKSIGMTKREFNRLVNLETIFYSAKSLFYGLTLGIISALFINYKFAKLGVEVGLPIIPILISIFSVFVLVFIIMRYSIRSINKNNIIDTIREDNI